MCLYNLHNLVPITQLAILDIFDESMKKLVLIGAVFLEGLA